MMLEFVWVVVMPKFTNIYFHNFYYINYGFKKKIKNCDIHEKRNGTCNLGQGK